MLASVLPVVLHGLSNPDLSVACVSALKRICRECRQDLHLHANDIMAVSQAVLVKDIHKSPQCMWIMQALGFLLSALPRDEILGKLLSLVTPHIQQLEKLANEPVRNSRALVHIFGCEKDLFSPIIALLELITNITMSIFHLGSRDHPDVVESFMQLHTQVLRRKADLYLSDRLDIKAVFYCGILSFKCPETPTLKATCLLFTELISHCEDIPAVREVLQEDGKLLLQTLLEAIGGQSPRSLAEHFAEVLFSVSRNCPSMLSVWLREALLPPGFPSSHLTTEHKEHFCQQILREQVSKRRMKDIVKEFALLSRGLQGTEYAANY
uniref:Si:ch73-182a11.2 n=1 Tax=Cyprinus carpio TaxID=7962 RepID=A0A8C2IRG6_CYPCA